MPRLSSLLFLALTVLSLAGCGLPPREPVRDAHMSFYDKYPNWKPGDPLPDETTPIATSAKPAPAKPTPETARSVPAAPVATPVPAAPQRQAALPPTRDSLGREPPPEPPKLEELRGLDAAQLTQLLGKPTLLRDEATAQMWQYRGETCVLHLFLYPSSGGEKRVQYVEARPRQTGAAAATTGPSECLATLVGARRLRS